MSWEDRISSDPDVLGGKAVVKGTRIAVAFVVDLLAQGWTEEDVLPEYPVLTREDVAACKEHSSAD